MRGAPKKTSAQALIQAAGTLFAARGVASVSVADLARACGVAKGTFYRYFTSKEALVDALFLPQAEALAAALTGDGGKPRIRAIAAALLGFFADRRLFLAELRAAYRRPSAFAFAGRARSAFLPLMETYFKRDGRYAVADLETYSEIVVGAVLDLCSYRAAEGRIATDEEARTMLEDLLKRFFDCEP
jgi:AcrR family transcriptional regulator